MQRKSRQTALTYIMEKAQICILEYFLDTIAFNGKY